MFISNNEWQLFIHIHRLKKRKISCYLNIIFKTKYVTTICEILMYYYHSHYTKRAKSYFSPYWILLSVRKKYNELRNKIQFNYDITYFFQNSRKNLIFYNCEKLYIHLVAPSFLISHFTLIFTQGMFNKFDELVYLHLQWMQICWRMCDVSAREKLIQNFIHPIFRIRWTIITWSKYTHVYNEICSQSAILVFLINYSIQF